jgi:hypothetical protein
MPTEFGGAANARRQLSPSAGRSIFIPARDQTLAADLRRISKIAARRCRNRRKLSGLSAFSFWPFGFICRSLGALSQSVGDPHKLRHILGVQLNHHIVTVNLDGDFAHADFRGNLFVQQS